MSRHGYSYDYDGDWASIMYRGAVASAINGKRGQAFLKEMLAAMDAMPEKRLITEELEIAKAAGPDGTIVQIEACAIGTVGLARNIDMSKIDPEDYSAIAENFGIAESMAREIMYENDEGGGYRSKETPEQRFARMRRWIEGKIRKPKDASEELHQ